VVTKAINAHVVPNMPPAPIYTVAFSPDGKSVVSGSLDKTLKLFDVASGNPVREFKAYKDKEFDKGHRDGVFCAAFSPNGQQLVSGGCDRSIKIWNVADGTVLRELVNPTLVKKDAPPSPIPQAPQAHPGWVYGVRYTADGRYIVSAGNAPGNKGYLAVWNAGDGSMVFGQALPLGPINHLALSPDSKTIAVGCGPQTRNSPEVNGYLLKMPDAVK
jgi:WD40 repeat protein